MSPEELKAIADRFSKQEIVQKHLRPFGCGSWVDPLALWSLERIGDRSIKWLIILLDWMDAKQAEQDAGDLESNVVYCGNYYTKPWTQEQSGTFTRLFWSWWSRSLLETRHCLVINAVWGVRRPEAKIGEVISVAEHIICAPIIASANPTRIFACGEKLSDSFRRISRVSYICHPGYDAWPLQQEGIEQLSGQPYQGP